METTKLLDRLGKWLAKHRSEYYAQLRPGLDAEQIAEFEDFVGFTFSDSFRELYRWHDGQSDVCLPLLHNQYFMPCAEVKSTWESMTSMPEAGEREQPQWWHRGWIPFLHNGANSRLCLDLHGTFTKMRGQIIEFWNKDEDRPIVAPSLDVWLEHFVGTLEAGLWHPTEGGNVSVHGPRVTRVQQEVQSEG